MTPALPPDRAPIVIVGLARSGTTIMMNLLSFSSEVHGETEPHLLWKSGDFATLADTDHVPSPPIRHHIRQTLLNRAGTKRLVEKSPPNALRPNLVHSVFPDAKIILMDRDPIALVKSNLARSQRQQPLSPTHLRHKYFSRKRRAGARMTAPESRLYVTEQIRAADYALFGLYVTRLVLLLQRGRLPFGPRLADFDAMVRDRGLLDYHVEVLAAWRRQRAVFETLYGPNVLHVSLEALAERSRETLTRVTRFCGLSVEAMRAERALGDLDSERVRERAPGPLETEIGRALAARGFDVAG